MTKVQLFTDGSISDLQQQINEWFNNNTGIQIIHTNLTSCPADKINTDDGHNQVHFFYVLYVLVETTGSAHAIAKLEEEVPLKTYTGLLQSESN